MIIHLYCGVFVQRTIQERGMHLITPYTGVSLGRVQRELYPIFSFTLRNMMSKTMYYQIRILSDE